MADNPGSYENVTDYTPSATAKSIPSLQYICAIFADDLHEHPVLRDGLECTFLPSYFIEIENQMAERKVELADLETISCYVDNLHDILKEGPITEKKDFHQELHRRG